MQPDTNLTLFLLLFLLLSALAFYLDQHMKMRLISKAAELSPVEFRWSLGLSNDFRERSGTWPVIEIPLQPGAASEERTSPFPGFCVLPAAGNWVAGVDMISQALANGGFVAHLLAREEPIGSLRVSQHNGLVRTIERRQRDCAIIRSSDNTAFCVESVPFFEANALDRTRWLSIMKACVLFHPSNMAISAEKIASSMLPGGKDDAQFSAVLNAPWFADACVMYLVGTAQTDSATAILRCPPDVSDKVTRLLSSVGSQ
jgi:hypothetical protein